MSLMAKALCSDLNTPDFYKLKMALDANLTQLFVALSNWKFLVTHRDLWHKLKKAIRISALKPKLLIL